MFHIIYWSVVILDMTNCYGLSTFVNIEYLRRDNRFNHSSYIDYYFSCNTIGPTLQWALNKESLIGYGLDDVGRAVVSMGQNFNYTTTLLSSQLEGHQNARLTSILIVSPEKEQIENFNVSCSNGLMINSTSTTTNPIYVEIVENIQTEGSIIALEQVLSARVIQNNTNLIHILLCGTADSSQIWGVNGEGIIFDQNDRIGRHQTETPDGITVVRQAILFARQPFETTSVLFVLSNSNISVICFFNSHPHATVVVLAKASDLFTEPRTDATSDYTTIPATFSQTDVSEIPISDSTTTTGGLKKDITGMVQNENSDILIGSVVGSIGIITLVVLFIATTTLCYILWRNKITPKKERNEENSQGNSQDEQNEKNSLEEEPEGDSKEQTPKRSVDGDSQEQTSQRRFRRI